VLQLVIASSRGQNKAGKCHGYIPEYIGDAPCITTRQIPLLGKKSPVLVCLEDENVLKWLTLGMEVTCSSAELDF
jgi:hypothetical protein